MGMQLVLLVLKLCILVVSSVVHGSAGYSISPSQAIFSTLPPVEELGHHEKSLRTNTPSASLVPNARSFLHSLMVSPPYEPTPVPQTIKGLAPSMPPTPPIVEPSHKSVSMLQTMPRLVPFMPPSPLMVVPSHKLALVPQTIPGLVPSMPPSPPLVEPSHKSAPMPQTMPRLMPPSPLIVVPSHKLASVPRTIQVLVPSIQPSPPKVEPSHKSAPLPHTIPRIVPSVSPSPPIVDPSQSSPFSQTMPGFVLSRPPSSPIVFVNQTIQEIVPSMPSRSSIVEPSHKSTPLPPTMQGLVPSMPPSVPLLVPSFSSAPIPSMPPSPPIVEPSHKSAPLSQTMPMLVPSTPPNPPMVVPSQKSAPFPQPIQGLVPSMPPNPPIVDPSHYSVPLPQTMPGPVPSMPPSPPIIVPSHKLAPLPQTMPPSSPIPVPLQKPAPPPQTMLGLVPSMPPSPSIVIPSHKSAPLPQTMPPSSPITVPLHKLAPLSQTMPGLVPSMPPSPPIVVPSHKTAPVPQTIPPTSPIAMPLHKLGPRPQTMPRLVPSTPPRTSLHRRAPGIKLPITAPHASVPVAAAPRQSPLKPSDPTMPGVAPSLLSDPAIPPASTPFISISRKRYGMPVAAPPKEMFSHLSPMKHSPTKGSFPIVAPTPHEGTRPLKWVHSPASSPLVSPYKYHHARKRAPSSSAPAPSHLFPPLTSHDQGSIIPPTPSHPPTALPKKSRQWHHHLPPLNRGPSVSPVQPPYSSTVSRGSLAPLPPSTVPSGQTKRPVLSPTISPSGSLPRKPKTLLPSPIHALPPPPPNQNCISLTCNEPLTNSPPGSPCACVSPMQVGLSLSVALYTFFPLVSELAGEIASGVFMKQSQVRIMGANAASQQLDKTIVLIDLVPLGESFDYTTAFLTYEKFWKKQVAINTSFFGDYEVLYVHYPGLPPSPPLPPSSTSIIDEVPYTSQGNNARTIHPLGVDVRRKQKGGLGGSTIAILVLSSFVAMVLCIGATWFLVLNCEHRTLLPTTTPRALIPSLAKQTGAAGSLPLGSGLSSASLSFGSSITYAGSARTFSADEVERATNNFDDLRILGEGGFGRVYEGILDDGTKMAVKVLKRDDQQGGREFLAEVEMLSRLHHRNLVKLIGICIEDHTRCLIYELIPNGSVESHLHGVDKVTAPLDWGARMKIALGSARGLAYLHEDSSPHVIHRDFKSSNILLEHDFTPKVSDFGLARTALDEENKHISTRFMGTFGYVAPEYAMTGHLLVKSDVYSYGVVLLELLTGRKPVDMSQPPGQENLVAWARPLLTSKDGLDMIIDPSLGSNFPFDSVAKVAAIASMCVQPEVSHRPFMGEVVQALKLVCSECDDTKEAVLESCGQEESSIVDVDVDVRSSTCSGQLDEPSSANYPNYDSSLETGRAFSVSEIFSSSSRFGQQSSGSLRRNLSLGPTRTERSRRFWQRVRGLSRGTNS